MLALSSSRALPGVPSAAAAPIVYSTTMLKGPVRIVPPWKELKKQIMDKLELQKGLPEMPAEGAHILLSDRPSIVFRESCFPDFMPLICFYTNNLGNYFASFTWRRGKGSKVRVWTYSMEEETPVTEKEYSLPEDPRVIIMVHVLHLHLLVAYCDDIHLRLFGDHTQDFRLLAEMSSPYSITSMCYNPENGEVVTGAIGMVAFWSFTEAPEDAPFLGVTQEVCIATGEFVHFLCVEPERRVLVALCENNIRAYDYQSKSQVRTFQVSQGVSLTCCSANWSQSFLYTGDLAGDIKVWNFNTGNQTGQFKAHLSAITSIISRASVDTLMTASLDGMVKEWNLTTCEQLRRVDIGEEIFQMQFLNEQTFFLRTTHSFSIRTLNNFYQLFNRCKCELRKLARIQCGPDKARILAATNDGVIRFLSPVTGEMLFVTWPFQLLEKALDYVYDPDREELLVTMGTSDVYVLDTTKNPSPAKYILHTSDLEDKVLCLAYSRLDLAGRTSSFIFTGYKSGKVRTVTQQLYRMGARRIHDGHVVALCSISASGNLAYHSRESSYLCSYGLDEYIVLSDVLLKKNNLLEVVPLVAIPSTNCRINQLLLIPGYICVLTEQNRVRLWRQASLVPGTKNPFWKETAAMHSTSITSFDYCQSLGLLVTGGSDGSVRIWDILGQLLVEFDTTLKFSRVCFANQRGDLVVGCNMDIYFISCVTYLPNKHLRLLANRHVRDEVVERPLPFLSRFLLSFDIVFVPKYRQLGRQAKKFERMEPITNHKEVVMEKDVAKVLEFMGKDVIHLPGPEFFGDTAELREAHPEFALEYQLLRSASFEKKSVSPAEPPLAPPPYRGLPPLKDTVVPLLRRIPFQGGRSWPIAPDGHVPNSVIRAQLFPKGTPETLTCPLEQTRRPLPKRKLVKIQLAEWDTSEIVEKARKKKAQRLRRAPSISEVPQRRRDLLAEIMSKPWLRHKPSDASLPNVLKAILNLMDDVPYSTYLLCIAALVQISESYQLTAPLKELAFERLFQDTTHKEVRVRLAAWEALGKMDLLTEQEVVPLARALLDENKKVRDLSRSLLDAVAGITDKYVLKKEMQRLAETSLEDLTELIRKQQTAFPRRVRAAGIVAETQDEAVYALTEGAARLMNRVENQLTANLFLLSECASEFKMPTTRPPRARRRLMSLGPPEEFAKPDSHLEAQARWLGLFAQSGKPTPPDTHKGGAEKAEKAEKLPRIQQARGKMASSASVPLPESSPSLSTLTASSSTSSSSSTASGTFSSGSATWQRPKTSKEAKGKQKQWASKILTSTSREARKLPRRRKQAQPILLQRRDTRTQLYTEMLKFQEKRAKKEQVIYATPLDLKPEASLPAKPSPLAIPVAPQPAPKGSLIDPKQQYNADKSKWRNDLYKLMMLRSGLSIEGRTAAQDFLDSARLALGGRAMSWEAFTNISRALLATEDKVTLEPQEWSRYMEDLFKASLQEDALSFKPSAPSMEKVLAVKGRDWPSGSETEVESSELSEEELVRGRRGVAKEQVAKKKKKGLDPAALASRISAVVPKAREGGKAPEKEEKGARKAAKAGKAESRVATRPKDQEEAQRMESEGLAKGRRPREGAKGREQEAVAKGREAEATRGVEPEGARWKEAEGVRGREREAAKRKEWEGAEKKEKEAPKRRLLKPADKRGPFLAEGKEEEGPVEEEVLEEPLPKEARRGRKVESLLRGVGKGPLKITESTVAQMRVEAKERLMTQLKKAALVEAEKAVLAEVRLQALAEAREAALAEAREWAVLQARRMTLAEAWEKVLAEAREKARQEVMGKALEEAQALALAEVAKGGEAVKEERVRELAEARAAVLAEERALELAAAVTLQVDEARVLELAATQLREPAEARIQELAEERAKELAKERAEELAEAKLLEMSESAILAMVQQMVEDELRVLLMEEEEWEGGKTVTWEEEGEGEGEEAREESEEEKGEEGEEKEEEEVEEEEEEEVVEEEEEEEEEEGEGGADMWEDLEEEELWPLSAEETEAFLSMLEKEPPPRADLELLEQAHLVLDILTEPEKPEHSDSETFERVCQMVSLLQVVSTTDAKELAEALVRKAEELVQEGEERQVATPEGLPSVLMKLKDVVEVRQPWTANPKQFARKMRALLKAALAVLRARNLKLGRRFGKKGWREKMEKAWVGEGGRAVGKKAWLRKKITEAVGKWKVEQEKVRQEELERQRKERRLQFRGKPILLGVSEREAGPEEKERKEKEAAKEEEEAAAEEERQRKARGAARRRVPRMTWSLGDQQRQRAWKAIMHLEKELPAQEPPQPFVPSRQRLSKGSLYKPTKPTKETRRKQLRKGGRQHVFRLEEDKGVDWERFTKLYQSLMSLKEVEGGVESAIWRVQSSKMLDLYGLSNPLIRAMVQQVLMGGLHQRRYLSGSTLKVREGQPSPGQRIFYELVHHSGRLRPTPAALHGIIPLSFQNNVHPFRPRGVTRFGTLAFKWKTYLSKGRVPRLRLYVHSGPT